MLPSRFPNLLVNGSTGIAVGMATNIPPHNLCEVVDAICLLIDNPRRSLSTSWTASRGRIFPPAALSWATRIRAAYATGRAACCHRARNRDRGARQRPLPIVIRDSYQVNKLNLVKSIIELADEKRVEGIHDVVDHPAARACGWSRPEKDANPQVVLNQPFAYTQMQTTFGVIMLALVNGMPRVLTLKQMLEEYIKFQVEVITRRTLFELRKARRTRPYLEALKAALDFIDEVINIIRSSPGYPQIQAAVDGTFRLRRRAGHRHRPDAYGQLAGLERQKIEEELERPARTDRGDGGHPGRRGEIKAIVKDECLKMRDKYGDERRTSISDSGEVERRI